MYWQTPYYTCHQARNIWLQPINETEKVYYSTLILSSKFDSEYNKIYKYHTAHDVKQRSDKPSGSNHHQSLKHESDLSISTVRHFESHGINNSDCTKLIKSGWIQYSTVGWWVAEEMKELDDCCHLSFGEVDFRINGLYRTTSRKTKHQSQIWKRSPSRESWQYITLHYRSNHTDLHQLHSQKSKSKIKYYSLIILLHQDLDEFLIFM